MPADTIWKAAFDGDLDQVRVFLAQDPRLLDLPFQETSFEIGWLAAGLTHFVKGSFTASMWFFAACATLAAPETGGGAMLIAAPCAKVASETWTLGDAHLAYFMRNIQNFRPLDCAAFGYARGNQESLVVAQYLISKGANGAVTAGEPNRRLFETFGNAGFNAACHAAIAKRQLDRITMERNAAEREKNILMAEKENFQQQLAQVQVGLEALNQRLVRTEADQIRLNQAREEDNQRLVQLQNRLAETNARLEGMQFMGNGHGYDFWRSSQADARQNPATRVAPRALNTNDHPHSGLSSAA